MCNTFIIIVSIFFSFLNSEESEKKEIPKLDLRDFNLTIDNIGFTKGLDNLLPDRSKENEVILLKNQIEAIKLNAKKFEPKPITINDKIIISTNLGVMTFKFYDKESPISSLNFKKLSNIDASRPGIIHRLDKDTSGIILVAKTDNTH